MTPQETLDRAIQMLLSPEFEPVIEQSLTNAKDVATAAAMLVYPIIYKLIIESDIPEEELLGNEEGDGIAIYLLAEVFEIANTAGIQGAQDRGMAERAVELLGDMLADAKEKSGLANPAGGADTQPAGPQPAANPMEVERPRGLLAGGQ